MKRQQTIFLYSITLTGFFVLCYCIYRVAQQMTAVDLSLPFILKSAVIILLYILCRLLPIHIASDKSMDVSFVPVVACAMIMGFENAVIFFAISSLFIFERDTQTGKLRYSLLKAPLKELCNSGNILISIFVGGQFLVLLGGTGENLRIPYSLLPCTLFAIVTIFCNLIIFIAYFTISGQGSFFKLFYSTVGGLIPNIISTLPFGFLLALILNMSNGTFFVVLFMLPLLLARYSFKLYLDSKSMYLRTVSSLSKVIEAKDKYTEGHSHRVQYFSVLIASEMRLRPAMIENIRIAALLHDIGKVGIDDNVLHKPSALTDEEYNEIKKHPVIGKDIIEEIRLPETINTAILYHHCNYDGTGYPANGPGFGKLPLAASIIAVADAYDAMTSDRPYRMGMTKEEAISILTKKAGTQFDPLIVKVFLRIIPRLENDHPKD